MADRLADLVRQVQTIEAIKLYRARTGEGVLVSKNAVEGLAQGISLPEVVGKLQAGIPPAAPANLTEDKINDYILGLIQDGDKNEAITWYSGKMGVSLSEAKQVVDRIASDRSWWERLKG